MPITLDPARSWTARAEKSVEPGDRSAEARAQIAQAHALMTIASLLGNLEGVLESIDNRLADLVDLQKKAALR